MLSQLISSATNAPLLGKLPAASLQTCRTPSNGISDSSRGQRRQADRRRAACVFNKRGIHDYHAFKNKLKKEKSTTSAVRTSNALLSPCFHLNHFVSVSTMVRDYTEGLHTTGRGQSNKKIQIFYWLIFTVNIK